ncbi:MAG: TIGR03086 family protein [Propionibacteriales bacterium]|nr:TIGR03086 family protein [Propionibacteriales bacterium]
MTTEERTPVPMVGRADLLERAMNYTLGSLHLISTAAMSHPTPCAAWDLRALLQHMSDSLAALYEGLATGRVGLEALADTGDPAVPAVDPVGTVKNRACTLLGACASAESEQSASPDEISIADRPLSLGMVTGTGAVEVAVHGWDVAQACGRNRPIPAGLAEELLKIVPFLVADDDRPGRFAPPRWVRPLAGPGDRLVAFLGRDPD